jgi:hypothetical protein
MLICIFSAYVPKRLYSVPQIDNFVSSRWHYFRWFSWDIFYNFSVKIVNFSLFIFGREYFTKLKCFFFAGRVDAIFGLPIHGPLLWRHVPRGRRHDLHGGHGHQVGQLRLFLMGYLHNRIYISENCVVWRLKMLFNKNTIDPIGENCDVQNYLLDCVNRP